MRRARRWPGQHAYTGDKEGPAAHPLYAVPNQDIRRAPSGGHVPVGPWRSVTNSYQGFFVESFADELAHAAGRDPFEFRRAAIDRPRHLRGAGARRGACRLGHAAAAGRGPLRRGRGIAIHESFGGTLVAEVCEVAIDAAGVVRVERVVAVVGRLVVTGDRPAPRSKGASSSACRPRSASASPSKAAASPNRTSTTIHRCGCPMHRASKSSSSAPKRRPAARTRYAPIAAALNAVNAATGTRVPPSASTPTSPCPS